MAARKVKGVHIGDLHVGGPKVEYLREEIDGILMPYLQEEQYDFVVQHGDWWHKRLPLDGEDAKFGITLATRITAICQQRDVPFRICKGTISHEYGQLDVLTQLETEFPRFRLIRTAQHEELIPGFDVLWMPEEYPKDYADFYNRLFYTEQDGELFQLQYDAIYGHGEIDVAINWANSEGEHRYGGTPTHSADELLAACSGAVIFGHVHPPFEYKKRLFYPGSFTRWVQGEEGAKSFMEVTQTEQKEGWKVEHRRIENTMARTFVSMYAEQIAEVTDRPDQIVGKIREASQGHESLRVEFDHFPLSLEDSSIIRGALVQDRNVTLSFKARPRLTVEATELLPQEMGEDGQPVEPTEGEEAAPPTNPFSYLTDEGMATEERLARYVTEMGVQVSLDDVLEYTAPLK